MNSIELRSGVGAAYDIQDFSTITPLERLANSVYATVTSWGVFGHSCEANLRKEELLGIINDESSEEAPQQSETQGDQSSPMRKCMSLFLD